jgi:hypothetical protein
VGISTIKQFTSGRGWGKNVWPWGLSYNAFNLPSRPDHKYIYGLGWGSRSHFFKQITLLFRASSKFRLIYCFFLVKSWFFIEKVHILRIKHFSETTKDKSLIFGMGGDANVKLCIQHFLSPGLSPTLLGNLFKKMWPRSPP